MTTHNTQRDPGVSKDAVRYLPVETDALGLTPMHFTGWTAPVSSNPIRVSRNADRYTFRRRAVDAFDNALIAIVTYVDNRHHRRSR